MKKVLLAIPAAAAVLAACGTAMTQSTSTISISKVSAGGAIQVAAGTKAADVSDITNRPNPPIPHGQVVTRPNSPAAPAASNANPGQPSVATSSDRCSAGWSPAGTGTRSAASSVKHPPLPMCAPE